jgi:hypothetical protein
MPAGHEAGSLYDRRPVADRQQGVDPDPGLPLTVGSPRREVRAGTLKALRPAASDPLVDQQGHPGIRSLYVMTR